MSIISIEGQPSQRKRRIQKMNEVYIKICKLIEKGIKQECYSYIQEAEEIAYNNGLEMVCDDEYTTLEDDYWSHKNVNEWGVINA